MAKALSDSKRETKENRERLGQLLTDLQFTLPLLDDWRVAQMLVGFRAVLNTMKEAD